MSDRLQMLTERLLNAAGKAGAEAADALAVDGTSLSIDVRNGALEQAERSEGIDIGLRVLIGRRQACVSASDISDATIEQMAERAVAMAREAPEDPNAGLADPDQLATHWDLAALELDDPAPEPDPATLEDLARRTEAAARAVEGISQSDGASAGFSRRAIHLAATNGFSGGYRRSSSGIGCTAITGEGTGMERDGNYEMRLHAADLPDAESIGRIAGERASARKGAKKPPTGAYPVLYDERISSGLIGHLLGAINGASVARGASWLMNAMGEPVLPDALSLTENPLRPRASGSRPFDAEGLPTVKRDIVANGVLSGWILDLSTARKLGLAPTGNASRGTGHPPSPSAHNVTLTPGTRTREDLLREMGTGLLVTSLIGSSINPTTGDYSRGASGFWVENGEITYPVNECTLAGNLRDMLRRITPANDARPHTSHRVPSLLVEGLTLAGA
ncbi:TldD/PmbA family protein [Pseudoruegeria sp. HB172150]|uniref:TldD/PmbA family protein n=1 Tax=Pseudoruegeria sp. HB172150 TaxID=2721164 RepID=UPI00155484C5|nr:TldD/PmbA family protein [Pseudoruegeria sp. HB172150]